MKIYLNLLLILFSILTIQSVNAQISVGVSPPVVDLGMVNRGETKIAKFNIITSSDSDLLVRLEPTMGKAEFFTSVYSNYIYNYSEEDTRSWVSFLSNPVYLAPINLQGTNLKGAREVTFLVTVPENAEPGFHNGYIMMDARSPKESKKQLSIKTVVPLSFLLQVPGEVIRNGKIYDLSVRGYSSDTVYLDVLFQNIGNVTMLVKSGYIEIFDLNDNFIDKVTISGGFVKPGQLKTFNSIWQINESFIPGTYRLEAKMYYSSGYAEKTTLIKLSELPPPPMPKVVEVSKEGVPMWLMILIILLVIGIGYWWYKKS